MPRTSSKVDHEAVTIHVNANGHQRKDPRPVHPLAIELAKKRERVRKPPQHTRKPMPAPSDRTEPELAEF